MGVVAGVTRHKADSSCFVASSARSFESAGGCGHFWSSEQHADSRIWLASYEFQLVFYSDPRFVDGTAVEI